MDHAPVPPSPRLSATPATLDVVAGASGGDATQPHAHRRQRELTRQYKETPRPVGVYAIRNAAEPARVYLGASLDIDGAINRHRFELGLKRHPNKPLLQAWSRWGAESFRFEVIDTVKPRDDPAFDPKAELVTLLVLWREELVAQGHAVEMLSK